MLCRHDCDSFSFINELKLADVCNSFTRNSIKDIISIGYALVGQEQAIVQIYTQLLQQLPITRDLSSSNLRFVDKEKSLKLLGIM